MGVLARKLLSADGPPYINELQRGAGDERTSNTSTHTTAALSIGAESSTRVVCALITAEGTTGSRTISSVTIGGVSATIVQQGFGNNIAAIAYATVTTGTTAVVDVTYSGVTSASRINTVAIDSGVALTLSDQDQATASSTTLTNTVAVLKDSFVVTCASSSSSRTTTWSNTTEWEDTLVDGGVCTFHSAITRPASEDASLDITATFSTSGSVGMVTLVFD